MQIRALERKARLWSPIGRRLALTCVRESPDHAVSDPQEKLRVLGQYWGPVFAKKSWDQNTACTYIRQWLPPVGDVHLPPPTP
eukprot:3469746-Pyramimonas_sp.AAC.1